MRLLHAAALSLCLLSGAALAQPAQQQHQLQRTAPVPSPALKALPPDSVTHHTLTLPDGASLAFTATAGSIRLSNRDTGAPVADIAYIAFAMKTDDSARRPVTFAMNGGPGYASAWLNLGALGPWRLPMDATGARPSASPALAANPESWLPFTDLVFLDPAGTGYSQIHGGDDVRKWLWSVNGDIDSLATTIRRWVEARGRGASPKYIAGESYGGFRAPKIAHRLQVDQGVGVDGLVLISPVLDFARSQSRRSLFDHVARLPSYAAAQRGLGRALSRADMADVEHYARTDFIVDLMAGLKDEAALGRLVARVSQLTGLPRELVARHAGRVPMDVFAEEFRRADKRVVSIYDALVTGLDPSPYGQGPGAQDQMRLGLHAPIIQAMVGLYRDKLDWFPKDGRYFFQNEQAGRQWDWGDRSRQEAVRDFSSAMALDPGIRTLIAHGLTDLVTPYFETQMVLDQMPPIGDPERLRFEVYAGGHMFYSREESRKKFRDDARAMMVR